MSSGKCSFEEVCNGLSGTDLRWLRSSNGAHMPWKCNSGLGQRALEYLNARMLAPQSVTAKYIERAHVYWMCTFQFATDLKNQHSHGEFCT